MLIVEVSRQNDDAYDRPSIAWSQASLSDPPSRFTLEDSAVTGSQLMDVLPSDKIKIRSREKMSLQLHAIYKCKREHKLAESGSYQTCTTSIGSKSINK